MSPENPGAMTRPRIAALLAAALMASAAPLITSGTAGALQPAPHTIQGDLGGVGANPWRTARKALERHAGQLQIDPADFRFESVDRSIVGTHVRGREFRSGVPVEKTAVAVHFVDGRVIQIDAYERAHLEGRPVASPVGPAAASAAALSALSVTDALRAPAVERLMVARDGRLIDTYRVAVFSLVPAVAATVDVDAVTGKAIRVFDQNQYIDGSATVFDPNPIVTLKDASLRQPAEAGTPVDADVDSAELTSALVERPLKDLNEQSLNAGRLEGPWVNVYAAPMPSLDGKFTFTRGDPRFEATMAYAHLDRIQRYYQGLGFKGKKSVNAESQDVVAMHVEGFDQSFYQPGNDLLLFGTGGVDDGEDAEVILHEYGHATQGDQVESWGATPEGGAMGEGFGDFLAGAYYARSISKGFLDECVAEWDATSYSADDPTCLRRLDGKKKYPEDIAGQVHDDGEIWSAFLWKLRNGLGSNSAQRSDNSIRLVIASHELLTSQAKFVDGVVALKTAARALGHAGWTDLIDRTAKSFGLETSLPK